MIIIIRVLLITFGVLFAVGGYITASDRASKSQKREMLLHLAYSAVFTAAAAIGIVGWKR